MTRYLCIGTLEAQEAYIYVYMTFHYSILFIFFRAVPERRIYRYRMHYILVKDPTAATSVILGVAHSFTPSSVNKLEIGLVDK